MAQADRIPGSDGGTLADLQSLIALRGEARRLAFATLLVQDPEIMLADEPVAADLPVHADRITSDRYFVLKQAGGLGIRLVRAHQPAERADHRSLDVEPD